MTILGTGAPSDLREWVNRLHMDGRTERDIEVPWAMYAINSCYGSWLDVGYAWTEPDFWKGVRFPGSRSVGLDIAKPFRSHPFHETIEADVTTADIPAFDLITCISTLEHIGCDNTRYAKGETRRDSPVALQREVVAKLRKAGKRLLVSVPFGMFEDHGWFLQYNYEMVDALSPTDVAFFRLDGEKCQPEELSNCLYRTDELRASAVALMTFEEAL